MQRLNFLSPLLKYVLAVQLFIDTSIVDMEYLQSNFMFSSSFKFVLDDNMPLRDAAIALVIQKENSSKEYERQSALSIVKLAAAISMVKEKLTLDNFETTLGGISMIGEKCLGKAFSLMSQLESNNPPTLLGHGDDSKSEQDVRPIKKPVTVSNVPKNDPVPFPDLHEPQCEDDMHAQSVGEDDNDLDDESEDLEDKSWSSSTDTDACKALAQLFYKYRLTGFVSSQLTGDEKRIASRANPMQTLIRAGFVTSILFVIYPEFC